MKQFKSILIITLLSATFFSAGVAWERFQMAGLKTQVITKPQAAVENWGKFYLLTSETTETYGTENMMSGMAEIMPGAQIHPPHDHAEEELLFILEGKGTWSIMGKEFEAKAGDLMYSQPWDLHGITNTGTDTLKFFFAKWNSKGVPVQEKD
jgi:gentisate 1,2-dioxygenase